MFYDIETRTTAKPMIAMETNIFIILEISGKTRPRLDLKAVFLVV
jgi:hypothetical protein